MNYPFLTGYERDVETDLDFAQERYYSGKQGRFISVDPLMASAKTGDPQTLNRFIYVFNNPLRYTDPDGMQAKSPWALLTEEEQKIISGKLDKRKGETDQKAFERIIGGGTVEETTNKVTLIKNFIDSAGGHTNSDVWKQVASIGGVWLGDAKGGDPRIHQGGGLTILVNDSVKFIDTLSKNGYVTDALYDYFNSAHPNASIRQETNTSWETGMHLANDDSSNLNQFFVHWDRRSTEFKNKGAGYYLKSSEQWDAGKSHHEPFPAGEIRQKLKQQGVVPRNEP